MRKFLIFILAAITLTFSLSCSKEDQVEPLITIISPIEYQEFDLPTKIVVKGIVEDDRQLQFVRVGILDERQATAAAFQELKISGNKQEFQITLFIDSKHLKSGRYYISATVSDGKNERKAFRWIYLSEVQKEELGTVVVMSTGQSTKAIQLDSEGNTNEIYSYSGDYIGSTISANFQTLTIAGKRSGDAVSINLEDNKRIWTEPSFHFSEPTFTGLAMYNGINYLSFFSGVTYGREQNGSNQVEFYALNGFYTVESFASNNRIIAFQKEITGGNKKKLAVYYGGTGFYFHDIAVSEEIVSICAGVSNEILAFGNLAGSGYSVVYNYEQNNLKPSNKLAGGEVRKAIQLENNTWLYSSRTGIYSYQPPNLDARLVSGNFTAIAFDNHKNQILAAEGNKLFTFSTNGKLISSHTFSNPIVGIHPWHNK
jgi:hypothetical protein